ncbi:unnamed protein product [Arctogadus glacialis]
MRTCLKPNSSDKSHVCFPLSAARPAGVCVYRQTHWGVYSESFGRLGVSQWSSYGRLGLGRLNSVARCPVVLLGTGSCRSILPAQRLSTRLVKDALGGRFADCNDPVLGR